MVSIITTTLGLILAVFVLLQQIAFWQRKEYRWDRMWAELTPRLQKPSNIWLLTTGIVLLSLYFREAWVGLSLIGFIQIYTLYARGVARPQPTAKAIAIGCIASILLIGTGLDGLLLVIVTPVLTSIAVIASNSLGNIQKNRLLQRARKYREAFPHLKVIGITGSYGKTSTKYFTHHLLASNNADEVVMSAAHRNEAFVIAQDMLAHVTPLTKIYIAEMGAYKKNEIKQSADITQPAIGVVTAIHNQHLALFGSLEQLAQAKWELIKSLPTDGIAVLNDDDATIQQQAKSFSGSIMWYSTQHPTDVYVEKIDVQPTSFSATFYIKGESRRLTIHLAGEGYVASATAATAAAYAAGAPPAQIFERLQTLSPIPQTMVMQSNSQNATIIDDSYSANEDGVLMALKHLTRFPQSHKIVVLRPLIELGSDTKRAHTRIGTAIAAANAELFIFDVPGAEDIEQAAKQAGLSAPIHRLADPRALAEALAHTLTTNTVCLLENRLPTNVRQAALA